MPGKRGGASAKQLKPKPAASPAGSRFGHLLTWATVPWRILGGNRVHRRGPPRVQVGRRWLAVRVHWGEERQTGRLSSENPYRLSETPLASQRGVCVCGVLWCLLASPPHDEYPVCGTFCNWKGLGSPSCSELFPLCPLPPSRTGTEVGGLIWAAGGRDV